MRTRGWMAPVWLGLCVGLWTASCTEPDLHYECDVRRPSEGQCAPGYVCSPEGICVEEGGPCQATCKQGVCLRGSCAAVERQLLVDPVAEGAKVVAVDVFSAGVGQRMVTSVVESDGSTTHLLFSRDNSDNIIKQVLEPSVYRPRIVATDSAAYFVYFTTDRTVKALRYPNDSDVASVETVVAGKNPLWLSAAVQGGGTEPAVAILDGSGGDNAVYTMVRSGGSTSTWMKGFAVPFSTTDQDVTKFGGGLSSTWSRTLESVMASRYEGSAVFWVEGTPGSGWDESSGPLGHLGVGQIGLSAAGDDLYVAATETPPGGVVLALYRFSPAGPGWQRLELAQDARSKTLRDPTVALASFGGTVKDVVVACTDKKAGALRVWLVRPEAIGGDGGVDEVVLAEDLDTTGQVLQPVRVAQAPDGRIAFAYIDVDGAARLILLKTE